MAGFIHQKHACGLFFVFCLFVFLLFACGGAQDLKNDSFVVGMEGAPTNLDPRFATGAYSMRIRPLIFDSLIEVAPDGTFTPSLAESWTGKDGLEYTFHLKKGVVFHDGRPLTSADVKYTFEYLRDPANKCPAGGGLDPIKSIETPDEQTVVFRLNSVFVPILFKLVKGIIPAHLGDDPDFAEHPIGSGPFRVVKHDRGERLVLAANEQYFAGAPKIKNLRFEVVLNDTTRLLRLKKGELDLVQNAIPPYAIKFLRRDSRLNVLQQPGINYSYMGFNLLDPNEITDNLLVRRAIAHSIDRDRIIKSLLKGQATAATGLLAPSNWAYTSSVRTYEYDPEYARRLLDQAGFPDPDGDGPQYRFTLSYKTSTNKLRNRIAEVMADQFAQVGIQLDRRSYEWGTFYEDVKKGNFQTFTLSWVGITDPDIYDYIFHSKNQPPVGANRGRFVNHDVDRLIEATRTETNRQKRGELFARIQQILAEDCVYVSLWWQDNIIVADKRLSGFRVYPGGEYSSLAQAEWKTTN